MDAVLLAQRGMVVFSPEPITDRIRSELVRGADDAVIEGASLEIPGDVNEWPRGADSPDDVLAVECADASRFRVFKYRRDIDPALYEPTTLSYAVVPTWETFLRIYRPTSPSGRHRSWHDQLRTRIREVRSGGGPPVEGVRIIVPATLSEPDFEKVLGVVGRLNDVPFGEAPAGTLEILSPAHWGDDNVQLAFLFRVAPPADFASSKGLMGGMRPGGRPRRIRVGVDFDELPDLVFPLDRGELAAIKNGSRRDAVVPVPEGSSLSKGDIVTFVEATADPFGTPMIVPQGDLVSLTLTEVRDQGAKWVGRVLFYIAWDREQARQQAAATGATK